MTLLPPLLDRIDQDFDDSVARLDKLLRIPSVSTDPAYKAETRAAGQWLVDMLNTLGFDASLRDTTGHPMVVGHWRPAAGSPAASRPHLLYYGHYDVQPPDPLELWDSPPFEPRIVEDAKGKRIVARGAVDDKGQVMTFMEAFRVWREIHGDYPMPITVLFEGEEECGSPSLVPFLKANKDELKADFAVVSDTGSWDLQTPAITYMLRGLLYTEITLHGPSRDLHSGMYGGGVANPLNALAKVIAALHDENGRIQIPGFYDDVAPVGDEEGAMWRGLGFDETRFLNEIGLEGSFGEKGFSALERLWARPTCDVNGMWGGYTGAGSKTVIAAEASAKISCRLVPDQDPQKLIEGLRAFLDANTPPGCRIDLHVHAASPAIRVPSDSPFVTAARSALGKVYDKDAVLIGCGGSIPVVGMMQNILGFDSLLMGFGLEDDKVHSPNEKFDLAAYRNGIRSHAAFLAEIAAG